MRKIKFHLLSLLALALPVGVVRAEGDRVASVASAPMSDGARKGFELLTTKPFTRGVFDAAEIEELWRIWEPEAYAKAESATPEERRKMTWNRYGLIERDFDKTGIPIGYVFDESNGKLSGNCFSCHAGRVAGKTIPGTGNAYQDLSTFSEDVGALRRLKRDEALARGEEYKGGRPNPNPGFVLNFSRGYSNAFGLSVVLTSFRDIDMNMTMYHPFGKVLDHDEDPPAWWTYKKKTKIYWTGFGQPTHRELMQFVMSPENSGDTIKSYEADFVFIEQYIRELEAPKWPFKVDAKLAAEGRELFEITCAKCHGTYGENPEYPNKVVPLAEIGTDPVRVQALPPAWKEFFNKSWLTNYGEKPFEVNETGYLAQPLDGIWASAPYFHNGSVPTLHHVLNPAERPKVFTRDDMAYDQKRVGLMIEAFEAKPEGVTPAQARRYYDTADPSHGNGGHVYPDELSAPEKTAVLEYLKTL